MINTPSAKGTPGNLSVRFLSIESPSAMTNFYSENLLGSADPSELQPNKKNMFVFMFMMLLAGAT